MFRAAGAAKTKRKEKGKNVNLQEAVGSIGLAVFNGGVTTFLALVLLGASSSHVFLSFFKVSYCFVKIM